MGQVEGFMEEEDFLKLLDSQVILAEEDFLQAEGFTEARARLAGRLERSGASGGEAKVRAHFARGGGGGTPLMLPEVLEILKRRIA